MSTKGDETMNILVFIAVSGLFSAGLTYLFYSNIQHKLQQVIDIINGKSYE